MVEKENVRVESAALDELRRAVVEKYGKVRGHLGEEASEAIRDRAKELKD